MRVSTFENSDLSALLAVVKSWIAECNANTMGIELNPTVYLRDLQRLVVSPDSDLLVLEKDNSVIGMMGLMILDSPLGKQKIANEHYWYVLPEHRGISSLRLIRASEQWAKDKGCSHLMLNASCLASNMHDSVCKIYERLGMWKFETTYIKTV